MIELHAFSPHVIVGTPTQIGGPLAMVTTHYVWYTTFGRVESTQ
jgi:hypothetical protein